MAKNKWNDENVLKAIGKKAAARMELACEFLEGDMKARASGHYGESLRAVDLGNYLNSFDHKVVVNANEIIGINGNLAEYAPHIEFGTGERAEDGQGRKGGWLYLDAKTGKLRFTLGMKPRPIMRSAFIENVSNLKKILGAV